MTHPNFNLSKAKKAANELYPTPPEFTQALLDNWWLPRNVWEPAAGNGDMVAVLRAAGHEVVATDLTTGQDFFRTETPPNIEAIVTNPPFSISLEWAERAVRLAPVTALLLPLYALGGRDRAERLWRDTPPAAVVVCPWRMRHATGTSHFNHMWAIWDNTTMQDHTEIIWAKEPTCLN